jgi:GrxC family glutaredoxin|tara:strand:- start:305 stop:547 length:243 start_codon:yes stop_codon:yes gene_type:complete
MVIIYSAEWCGPCVYAKKLLNEKNIQYKEIDIEKNDISREDLEKMTGGSTVPQIIINDKCIGGFDQLLKLEQSGELNKLL